MCFKIKTKGDLKKTKNFLEGAQRLNLEEILSSYGKEGVAALASATPVDSGKTSESWDYEIEVSSDFTRIVWTNHNLTKTGDSIAVLLQYGHGTGTGGYVQGIDYINPAMEPIFNSIAERAWKAVVSL